MIAFKPPAAVRWRYAIAEHQKGDARRLVSLLCEGGEVPPFAREYLAQLAAASAKRPRGRPRREKPFAEAINDALHPLDQQYELALLIAKLDDTAPGTPSERALEALAARLGVSVKTVERRLRKP